jgi:pimeloyl-ACP methyl ester carboxylesterase
VSSTPVTPLGLQPLLDSPVPGLAVYQRTVANPRATIICAHGGLDRGGSFARMARRIEDFNTLAYDRRGYQGSRELHPLSLDHHINDLVQLATWAGQSGPVMLFGHSYGGIVSLGASIRAPQCAELLVAYESPMQWVLPTGTQYNPVSDDPAHEAERFFRRMVSDASWERLSEKEKQSRHADGLGLISDLTAIRTKVVPYDVSKLQKPATYVHGDAYRREYYAELGNELHRLNPLITTRQLSGANHGAHLAIPDQVIQLLRELWESTCE